MHARVSQWKRQHASVAQPTQVHAGACMQLTSCGFVGRCTGTLTLKTLLTSNAIHFADRHAL